jgi:cyclophilin family peptidyl-prolyl cis-trans isomerase
VPPADKRARQKENARAARLAREAAEKRRKRRRSIITFTVVGVLIVGLFVIASIAGNDKDDNDAASTATTSVTTADAATGEPTAAPGDVELDPSKTYKATIATNFGDIVLTLDTKNAPIGAAHFVTLARAGVYDGSRWHRIIKDFVIQGGAPDGDPNASYGKAAVAEVPKGGYELGDIAAAKTEFDPAGTFDSQFYIVTGPQGEALPADYADFGTVTSGMDVVRKIEALQTDANDEPTAKATIDKVTITES